MADDKAPEKPSDFFPSDAYLMPETKTASQRRPDRSAKLLKKLVRFWG
ncbi:hypothetical protein [Novosphingobium sp. FKTRR1]|nr:hypothetical protein [Novosphingobium sp. FKTRR1]